MVLRIVLILSLKTFLVNRGYPEGLQMLKQFDRVILFDFGWF